MGNMSDDLRKNPGLHSSCVTFPCVSAEESSIVFARSQWVEESTKLFNNPVLISNKCTIRGCSDNMACTHSGQAESSLLGTGVALQSVRGSNLLWIVVG